MRTLLLTMTGIILVGLVPAGSAFAQCYAVCDQPVDAYYSLFVDPSIAQVMIPQSSGPLGHVSVFLSNGVGPGDAVVEILTTVAGAPSTTILATATIAGIGAGAWYSADFSAANLTLTAGTGYALVVRTPVSNTSITWHGQVPGECRGNNGSGSGFEDYDLDDIWEVSAVDFLFEVCQEGVVADSHVNWGSFKSLYR